MVLMWSSSKRAAALSRASNTLLWRLARCSRRFWGAIARLAMRSVVERIESGRGRRYVASAMSRGKSGCVPVTAKYGEQPNRLIHAYGQAAHHPKFGQITYYSYVHISLPSVDSDRLPYLEVCHRFYSCLF